MKNTLKSLVMLTALFSAVSVAFAEDAPVYDIDQSAAQYDSPAHDITESTPQTQYQPPQQQDLAANEQGPNLEQHIEKPEQPQPPAEKPASRLDLSAKVESLQSEIQALRGQMEELTHQMQQMQAQAKAMAAAPKIAARTTPAEEPLPAPKAAKKAKVNDAKVATASNEQPNVAEEQQIYQTAYNLIKAKKYNEAISSLEKMLQKYPTGQFAANAHYWLGELYGILNKNDQSAAEFNAVISNYPDSPKVADAQLKIGLIYAAQFKWTDARGAFKTVINRYPGSASARLAGEQLKQIKLAGH